MGVPVMAVAEYIALAGLTMNILVAVVGLTWGVAKIRDTVRDEIEQHREKFDGDLHQLRLNTGEIGAALRQKITEVELFNRDTFMRRDSFYEVMKGYGADMRSHLDKIEQRLERMESKIDSTKK